MPFVILELQPLRVAKADSYNREQLWLRKIAHPDHVALALDMERTIIADDGFPLGCERLRPKLQLFTSQEWQEIVDWLEQGEKGNAMLALTFIEHQLAYRRREITIIYTVVPTDQSKLIVFDSINFPGRPLYPYP